MISLLRGLRKEISIFRSNMYQIVHRSLIWMDLEKDMVRSGIITYGLYPSEEVSKRCIGFKTSDGIKDTHCIYQKKWKQEKESATITHM